jgi:hypothetical protein
LTSRPRDAFLIMLARQPHGRGTPPYLNWVPGGREDY